MIRTVGNETVNRDAPIGLHIKGHDQCTTLAGANQAKRDSTCSSMLDWKRGFAAPYCQIFPISMLFHRMSMLSSLNHNHLRISRQNHAVHLILELYSLEPILVPCWIAPFRQLAQSC